jgi:hypothetical protein
MGNRRSRLAFLGLSKNMPASSHGRLLVQTCQIIIKAIEVLSAYILREPTNVAAWSKAWGLCPLACWNCGFESNRGAWMSLSDEGCVLSRKGLCDGLTTRPEDSYQM